jgi:hypothetical protein
MGGWFVLPLLRLATSAALSGQQCPAGCYQRGHERLEQVLERGSAVGLTGHEGAVDGGEREARELVSDRALWIVAERDRDLRPQQLKRVLADAAHDGLDLPIAGGWRLRGEDDQQAQPTDTAIPSRCGGHPHSVGTGS